MSTRIAIGPRRRRDLSRGLDGVGMEVVWPSFPDLKRLLSSVDVDGALHFLIEWDGVPTPEERHDCRYLLREIAQAAFGPDTEWRITCAEQPADAGYSEVMSDAIFRNLAAEVAPP